MSSDSVPSDSAVGQQPGQAPSGASPDREGLRGEDGTPPPLGINYLILSLASLCVIVFGVWLVSAGQRYREEYAHTTEGWRIGGKRAVELTLVKEDKYNLACASDQAVAGLRCGGALDVRSSGLAPEILQPYNTIGGDILLGAGLWSAPDLSASLPDQRFTVVCTYNIKGVIKSAGIRFSPTAPFGPLNRTVTVGTFTDCMIPR